MASILLIALLIAASGTLVYAVKHAADGFEDDNGFHSMSSSNAGTPAPLQKFMSDLPGL